MAEGARAEPSPFSPFRVPLFQAFWLADLGSELGTLAHTIGAVWIIVRLNPSPLLIALVQSITGLALFFAALPGGALSDMLDRRKLLIGVGFVEVAASAVLAGLAFAGLATVDVTIGLTLLMGIGAALGSAGWQAIKPEVVAPAQVPAAMSLGSLAMTLGRAVGPFVGGVLIAAISPWVAFALNAAVSAASILVLVLWRRPPTPRPAQPEELVGAMRAAVRYGRHSRPLRIVLLRTAAVVPFGVALYTLLPLVDVDLLKLGASEFAVLLGAYGAGSIAGTFLYIAAHDRIPANRLLLATTWAAAVSTAVVAVFPIYVVVIAAVAVYGIALTLAVPSLSAAAQRSAAGWVGARAMGLYLLVLQGSVAGGSLVWGLIDTFAGIRWTLAIVALGLAVGTALGVRWSLSATESLHLAPVSPWAFPETAWTPAPEDGPVLVTITYTIDQNRLADFLRALDAVRPNRLRDGALRWSVYRDLVNPNRLIEAWEVESWAEHVRQHDRVVEEDQPAEDRVRSFNLNPDGPEVQHLIYSDFRMAPGSLIAQSPRPPGPPASEQLRG